MVARVVCSFNMEISLITSSPSNAAALEISGADAFLSIGMREAGMGGARLLNRAGSFIASLAIAAVMMRRAWRSGRPYAGARSRSPSARRPAVRPGPLTGVD